MTGEQVCREGRQAPCECLPILDATQLVPADAEVMSVIEVGQLRGAPLGEEQWARVGRSLQLEPLHIAWSQCDPGHDWLERVVCATKGSGSTSGAGDVEVFIAITGRTLEASDYLACMELQPVSGGSGTLSHEDGDWRLAGQSLQASVVDGRTIALVSDGWTAALEKPGEVFDAGSSMVDSQAPIRVRGAIPQFEFGLSARVDQAVDLSLVLRSSSPGVIGPEYRSMVPQLRQVLGTTIAPESAESLQISVPKEGVARGTIRLTVADIEALGETARTLAATAPPEPTEQGAAP